MRIRGEWFRYEGELVDFVEECARQVLKLRELALRVKAGSPDALDDALEIAATLLLMENGQIAGLVAKTLRQRSGSTGAVDAERGHRPDEAGE